MTAQSESQIRNHPDDWSTTSDFHHHVERTTHPAIVELIQWLTQTKPFDSSSTVIDDGCGLGTVTAELKKSFPNIPILATDFSTGMIEIVKRRVKEKGWKNVEAKVLDGGHLTGVSSASMTHAFGAFFLDFAHNATACVQELHRVTAPGGIVGIISWVDPTHPSISAPWAKACRKLYPDFKVPFISNPKFSSADTIRDILEAAGWTDVQTKHVTTHWRWESADEMAEWFFESSNPVCRRWHEALTEEVGGNLEEVKAGFQEALNEDYRREGGQLVKGEVANLTIARK